MKNLVMMVVVLASSFGAYAQYRVNGGASLGPGAAMFTLGVEREFNVISDKFHVNPGVRLSVYNGNDLEYITAPAEYTSNDDQVDTMTFGTVQNNFANLYVRLGYDFTERFSLSFDIDIVGVSFGSEQNYSDFRQGAALRAQPQTALGHTEKGSPTTFNLLLVGDNDIGSLNSTLNISYDVTKRLGIDLGVGLIFTEYTIVTGRGYDGNDRFRNKNMMGYLGISYLLGGK
ncbi:MAG: hypothetical protein ACJAR8_000307 [Bacteroidia bacterium]|jgi:hypothetical protein|nr:hypothetical protein [Bacteroidota bacterium]